VDGSSPDLTSLPHSRASKIARANHRRLELESFIHLAKRITNHREGIEANLEYGLSQGLIESINAKIRLLTRAAYDFHGPEPLIALAMLALGSHPPQLPGRT
jgi:transposase